MILRLALYLLLAVAAFAVDLKVGTLNTYLLFDPVSIAVKWMTRTG